jgi:pentose-5-phosphate-3-epimerase
MTVRPNYFGQVFQKNQMDVVSSGRCIVGISDIALSKVLGITTDGSVNASRPPVWTDLHA